MKEARPLRPKHPRLAVRAVIVVENRLLLVNAWPGGKSALMCAPGGGISIGSSLPDNLIREVHEETGLRITVGPPCLVNEFHDPDSGFHQVEVFFRCAPEGPVRIDPAWQDPEGIVHTHRWASEAELQHIPHKPDSLAAAAFGAAPVSYDPLERLVF